MSKPREILLRIQSPEGVKRIEITQTATLRDLYEAVFKAFGLNDYGFAIFKERNFTKELASSRSQTVSACNLKHGDMLYMKFISGSSQKSSAALPDAISDQPKQIAISQSSTDLKQNYKNNELEEDEVDLILSKMDGRIQRSRDNKLCRHNSNGCCVHCSALEPYDENYLKEHNIKHLSFHSYLRKQMSGIDRGKYVAFEDINCRIKSGCRDHPPWPKGICSKCQPSAITLNRQIYRHVDNVMFENASLVDRFLNYWRVTGHQRLGFLFGTYEVYPDVPLGIRARVAAIYEPPQESTRDSIKLLDDEHEAEVDALARALGLKRVGWIFTDLIGEEDSSGNVKHVRGIETHFLTAQECIMAGYLQNKYPNVCKQSPRGILGSKFVTVCVTGDAEKQIKMEGYSVSAQCMALVRDNCLVPTKDVPELGYVRESTDKQFVPDVYYKEKDQYGNEVQRLARPLPVEYLLVEVPATTPVTPVYTFTASNVNESFPIENRYLEGHLQDFGALSAYLSRWDANDFLDAISDFHLLIYLYKMDVVPIKEHMKTLIDAVRTKNKELAYQFKSEENWRTLETLIAASSSGSSGLETNATASAPTSATWTCKHCTFINRSELSTCEMCSLPR